MCILEMISIELWRARIGGWRGSAKSAPAAGGINPDLLTYLCKFMASFTDNYSVDNWWS